MVFLASGAFCISAINLIVPALPASADATGNTYSLVSADENGIPGDYTNDSGESISGNGQYVAFASNADNLVPSDTNSVTDVFVKDVQTGAITRVSVASDGTQANNESLDPTISSSGRYVVFESFATNIGGNPNGSTEEVYMHDMQTGTTSLISDAPDGTPADHGADNPSVTSDGRYVVFRSYSDNLVSGVPFANLEIFEKDTQTGNVYLLSKSASSVEANASSGLPKISCDGNSVVFTSHATNLPGYAGNSTDVYLDDLSNGGNQISNITANGNAGGDSPNISCDGNSIVFDSSSTNLVSGDTESGGVFEYNRSIGSYSLVSVRSNGSQLSTSSYAQYPATSNDGRYTVFTTVSSSGSLDSYPTNSTGGLYVHDNVTGTTKVVAINQYGITVGDGGTLPVISGDGTEVAFTANDPSFMSGTPGGSVYLSTFPAPAPATPIQAINAGGDTADSYAADTGFSGGTTYSSSAPVDTSGVQTPAPQAVYQSARYGNNFSYTFSGLSPNASYTLRLDFNELYWGTAAAGNTGNNGGIGSRVFNVGVNGQSALSNFDIYAAAGGSNKAIVEEIPATADANGNVTVSFAAVTDTAMVSGLALFNGTSSSLPQQPPASTSAYISSGGSANGPFSADQDYSGGTPYTSNASVDASQVTNPAPESVYQSARYGTNFTYTIPNLTPNTSFNVRLDFNELYWGTPLSGNSGGSGSRVFNVAINGNQVLNNFDIYQTAGGANKAIAENFPVTSDANGRITIQFTAVTDNAMVSGIEVTQQ
jgi:hypothetical protein